MGADGELKQWAINNPEDAFKFPFDEMFISKLIERMDSNGEIPFKPRYGATISPHCTALGKAIAASIGTDVAHELVRRSGFPKLTPRTIGCIEDLEAEFARTRSQGYALDLEESAEGACCVGGPVRDWSGSVVAAISVSLPATRFYGLPEGHIAGFVTNCAAELSLAAGHRDLLRHIA